MNKKISADKLIDDPLWYKDAIIYQVHVKSFFDSNNDGIGDFKGLLSKLDYIVELGVDTIWIQPFYPSPRRDDGYDIAEYSSVHPDYGSLNDVKKFINAAHARGLRIITELVINHTSDQHPWFQRARHAKKGSNFRKYYVWADDDKGFANTRIIFLDTEPSNWTYDPIAQQYYWHRFYAHQPDLNFDHPPVLEEVLAIMKFWMKLGVDGFRLDAIPYLVEREGTSNENLPETHRVLKTIRAALDKDFKNRLLLAEANQWPEDVKEYFSEGDECHMAFNFPLMPRLYMSLASEDRFPITDIMRQMPEIPFNCQWAIFLRNHDELTLEMVTDSERDYLWNMYASDRRARLNLGIRRRLAPLLEHDRRRIELINSLLLSLPGTPTIYYGDEIGMGDNIHLGDRDGVRTPMQWSADRNGGFSRADPEQLVLPANMGALYGYSAVSVEAQSRDPHSLLNWMRKMLVIRRSKKSFGRGTSEFLKPANRKILVYLREYSDEAPILCVANLSRAPQAVELELSKFYGRVPVELTGDAQFPPIGQLPYLLTLPPYGFYWFQLCNKTILSSWINLPSEQLPDFHTFVIKNGQPLPSKNEQKEILEKEVLSVYLQKRRWFISKDEKIIQTRILYLQPLSSYPNYMIICEVAVDSLVKSTKQKVTDNHLNHLQESFDSSQIRTSHYFLPMGISWDLVPNKHPLVQQLALARVRSGRNIGFLTDAFSLTEFATILQRLFKHNTKLATSAGEIHFHSTQHFSKINYDDLENLSIRWLSAEQSNSTLIIDDKTVLKLVRHIVPGIHPECEMTAFLTQHNFPNIAPLLGEIIRTDQQANQFTLAILQGYVENQGDAWQWIIDHLKRAADDLVVAVLTTDSGEPDSPIPERDLTDAIMPFTKLAQTIGKRLAEMHLILSQKCSDKLFMPEPITANDWQEWIDHTHGLLDHAFNVLEQIEPTLDKQTQSLLNYLKKELPALHEKITSFQQHKIKGLKIRIHGDFHLGQILIVQDDVYFIDFEGEPVSSMLACRQKTSPYRDVASLLRSFSYVSIAALPTDTKSLPAQVRKRYLFEQFCTMAQNKFIESYHQTLREGNVFVNEEVDYSKMIQFFIIEKTAYEICYEAENRPEWLNLPLEGLVEFIKKLNNTNELPYSM